MRRDLGVYLQDIVESIERIEAYTRDVTDDDFCRNTLLQDGVVRRLEIIGEATKHIPRRLRERYPDIPWQDVVGMRNRLSHEYFGVQLRRVWKVVREDLATLKTIVLRMSADLKR
ncbi:MAG: DUF86 domain-containing protein [Chloroflexi bacterium]|nr:DUF86 domain-containing protein [Chloroflexota bacterium]